MLAKLKGFRTIIVNALMSIVPVLEASGLAAVLPDGALPWYVGGMAVANVILRCLTDTPVGRKAPKRPEFNGEHAP